MPDLLMRLMTHAGFDLLVRYFALCAMVVASVGCRETPTTVQGQVTLDGKPLTIGKGMRGTVIFQPTNASGTTLSGLIDAHGRYELAAGGSVSVTPSNYWVTVSAMEIVPPSADQPQASGRLVTPAKYASATDSGFRIEVLPGTNEINLPLMSETEESIDVEADAPSEPEIAEPAQVGSNEANAPAPK